MSYAYKRVSLVKDFTGSQAKDTDLARFLLPTNKEIELYNLRAYVATSGNNSSSGLAGTAKLLDSALNVLASVSLSGKSGIVNESTELSAGPVKFVYSTGLYSSVNSDTCLKLQFSDNTANFVGTVQADFSYPGSK